MCIRPDQICDTLNDCGDQEDEYNCTEPEFCRGDQIPCPVIDYLDVLNQTRVCITLEQICDGVADCPSAADELRCSVGRFEQSQFPFNAKWLANACQEFMPIGLKLDA